MKLSTAFMWPLLAVLFRNADGVCYSSTEYAHPFLQVISNVHYTNNDHCTIYISPFGTYSPSDYYLEIKWISFNIEGNMPNCKDYVEVFLTSSYKSIGRYCSDNIIASKPFDMYSHDGYAKIVFKSDSSVTRSGFSLTYQLKSKLGSPMGGSRSRKCYYSLSGNVFTSGWPYSYYATSIPCWHRFEAGPNAARIAIMDVSLYDSYVEVKESSTRYGSVSSWDSRGSTLTGRLSETISPAIYKSTKHYVYFYFNRPFTQIGYRGVMAGYMAYRNVSDSTSSKTSVGAYVGIAIGCLAVVILIVVAACCWRKRARNSCGAQQQSPSQGPTAVAFAATNVAANVPRDQQQMHAPVVLFNEGNFPVTWATQQPQFATGQVPNSFYPGSLPPKENTFPPQYSAAY
ncbi:uncharacterized protein LOC135683530 [Rhopilema esculentum]|uniref:uncharacterized protein LOC135683530 n=1 Tax=Rhopilema esculentum TaxID=499914 RepID=UPI0031D2F559